MKQIHSRVSSARTERAPPVFQYSYSQQNVDEDFLELVEISVSVKRSGVENYLNQIPTSRMCGAAPLFAHTSSLNIACLTRGSLLCLSLYQYFLVS
jgi:hypothetical protein